MSPKQGWLESDEDFRHRVAQEADERTIQNSSGSAPNKGWFESDQDYRDRVAQEANEHRVKDSSGDAPSRGWIEGEDSYRERIAQEANERTIEDATGSTPAQGWFESDSDYDVRIRREANEHIVIGGAGSSPKQGWFEGDHDYRSRVAHKAREVRASDRPDSEASIPRSASSGSSVSYGVSGPSTSSDSSGLTFVPVVVAVGLIIAAFSAQQPSKPTPAPYQPPRAEPLSDYLKACSPMHEHQTCDLDRVVAMIDAGADPNAGTPAPLREAIISNLPPPFLEALIKSGASVTGGDRTPIMDLALSHAHVEELSSDFDEKLSLLLSAGADLDAAGVSGQTALLFAVENGSQPLVAALISAGASTKVVHSATGLSPLDIAIQRLDRCNEPLPAGQRNMVWYQQQHTHCFDREQRMVLLLQ